MRQIAYELVSRLVPTAAVAVHHPPNDRGQIVRNARIDGSRVRCFLALMIEQFLQHGPFWIRRSARQHVVHRAAERINVAANIDRPRVFGLVRRDVVECAECRAWKSQVRL